MFGIVTAQLSTISDAEKERYHALYCGLCRALKERYGQISRVVLTYDLTFYIMLCNSLHEPAETTGAEHCVTHPVKKMPFAQSKYTDYAADLAVALAYHKCLDDWNDDRSKKARAAQLVLKAPYERACQRIGEQCRVIEQSMAREALIEADPSSSPDAAAREFGSLLGELFKHDQGIWSDSMQALGYELGRFIYLMDAAVDADEDREHGSYNPLVKIDMTDQGIWSDSMQALGYELGRFIYLMDAAVDADEDREHGSYNPLVKIDMTPEDMEALLSELIGRACAVFEKLPLEQDLHLMRSILYAGVWQKFNETYRKQAVGSGAGSADKAANRGDAAPAARAPERNDTAPAARDAADTASDDTADRASGEREHHD